MSRSAVKVQASQGLRLPPRRSNSVSPQCRIAQPQRPLMGATMNGSKESAGAVSEEQFRRAFDDFPKLPITSGSDVQRILSEINAVLDENSEEWEKRIDALRTFRGVLMADGPSYAEYNQAMRYLDLSLQKSVRDLRSQVARDAAITVALIAERLGIKAERTMEMVLPALLTTIPMSVKVVSSAGLVAIKIVLMNVPSAKLLPIITQECFSSKSKDVRRACCEFVGICLEFFPKPALDRHAAGLQEAIRKGLVDADEAARSNARRAYGSFAVIFPLQAREIYSDMDAQTRKRLDDDARLRSSQSDLRSDTSMSVASRMPKSTTSDNFGATYTTPSRAVPKAALRSISAVDSAAARKAKGLATLTAFRPLPGKHTVPPSAPLFRTAGPELQRSIRRHAVKGPGLNGMSPANFEEPSSGNQIRIAGVLRSDSVAKFNINLSDVLVSLNSANWSTKREGLENLERYMRHGKSLTLAEIESVLLAMNKLLNESSTRFLGAYLDCLYDFLKIYALQIGSGLYELLKRIWNKQTPEISESDSARIQRALDLIRESFPTETLIQHVMRYLTDQSSTSKNKLSVLNFFITLVQSTQTRPDDLRNASLTRLAISRLVSWAFDVKNNSVEVRDKAHTALVLLNEINSKEFVGVLESLEQDLHMKAVKLIACYPRRPSVEAPELTMKRNSATPLTKVNSTVNGSAVKKRVSSASPAIVKANDENRRPSSKEAFLPAIPGRRSIELVKNGTPGSFANGSEAGNGDFVVSEVDFMKFVGLSEDEQHAFFMGWSEKIARASRTTQYQMLMQMNGILNEMTEQHWEAHFMTVMPMLYNTAHLAGPDSQICSKVLNCMSALFRHQSERMADFPELSIVNIIETQKTTTSSVTQAAEDCIRLAVHAFPVTVMVKILLPIMMNDSEPENHLAIRFVSIMCKELGKEPILPVIPDVVPVIVKIYEKSEVSAVRKECVNALIRVQLLLGEEAIKPYLVDLPSSKIRLINVYLKRETPVSPGGEEVF